MYTGFRMFLLLAEELNFNRAAQRAFVTQQCLSDHIRRLEQKYHTTLFQRKPKVSLTEAGIALLEAVQRIQMIEDGVEKQLCEIENGLSGTLKVGITVARSHILIPRIVPPFHHKYPGVNLQFEFGDTQDLINRLYQGKLDCLIGINAVPDRVLRAIPLSREHIYLLASEGYLRRYFGLTPLEISQLEQQGVDLRRFEHLPLVRNHPDSTLSVLVDRFLGQNQISLCRTVAVSDYSIQISLCAQDNVAAICPSLIQKEVQSRNELLLSQNQLHIFPISGLTQTLQCELICHADAYYPLYARDFFAMIKQVIPECYT